MRRLALPTLCVCLLPLAACKDGYLSEVSGDFGVAFTTEPDCIEIDVSEATLTGAFTAEVYLKGGSTERYGLYPVLAWPGAFALYRNAEGLTVFGPTESTDVTGAAYTTAEFIDGEYHHLAVTWSDAGEGRIYVDGSSYGFAPVELLRNVGSAFYVGCWPSQREAVFDGVIGEVHLASGVRYDSDFEPSWTDYAVLPETIGLWHLNEGRDTGILDEVGLSDGVLTGGEWVGFPMAGVDPDDDAVDDTAR